MFMCFNIICNNVIRMYVCMYVCMYIDTPHNVYYTVLKTNIPIIAVTNNICSCVDSIITCLLFVYLIHIHQPYCLLVYHPSTCLYKPITVITVHHYYIYCCNFIYITYINIITNYVSC